MFDWQALMRGSCAVDSRFSLRAFNADLWSVVRDMIHALCTTPTVTIAPGRALALNHGRVARPIHAGCSDDPGHVAVLRDQIAGDLIV